MEETAVDTGDELEGDGISRRKLSEATVGKLSRRKLLSCLPRWSEPMRTDGRKRGENVIWGLHLLVYYRWNNGRVTLPSYNHVGNPQGSCGILGPAPRVFAT